MVRLEQWSPASQWSADHWLSVKSERLAAVGLEDRLLRP